MPTYRLHKLDETGKFDSSERLDATDDAEAMKLARAIEHHNMCEVWLARRLVGRFSPFMFHGGSNGRVDN
jgi:hypothetical protein